MTEENVSSVKRGILSTQETRHLCEVERRAQALDWLHFHAWLPVGMLGALLCACVMAPGRESSQRTEEERVALL